ncbi:MAG: YceI family protein [Pseudomonadota bacterium]
MNPAGLTAPVILAALAMPALAAETYYTDQGHTEVRFGWSHAGVSMQTGEFTKATGTLVLDPDNVEQSSISVTIDAASVSTGFEALDKHLKTADFLEVETYPEITFVSTAVEQTGDTTANVTGDLTIHGVTKPVTLETTMTHRGEHPVGAMLDYYKGQWVAFSATTEIDHQAFNVGSFSTGPISITIVTEMKDHE